VSDESKLVASTQSLVGLALAALGWWRDSRLLLLAGGFAIGAGLKLVPPAA
jgi:hypothetical protein